MTAATDSHTVQRILGFGDAERERLEIYVDLLLTWQRRINLISPASVPDLWLRHVLDSAQLLPFFESGHGPGQVYDLGSGAGFPGLILAILGVPNVHLVESDQRKAAFLREANRITGAGAAVEARRAETLEPESADFVTARALASLTDLLSTAHPILRPGGRCLFLKGARVDDELTVSGKHWKMMIDRYPSRTGADGVILQLKDICPRHG